MKGFAGVTQEEDLYLTGPLLKDTGGQACKRRHKNMLGNVISVRNSRQTLGPFPKAIGNKKYLLVSIDYFTKWVKAKPLANIRDVDV